MGEVKIGIGDMKIRQKNGLLITYALGSCIGITFYDPAIRLGALLHIMLPSIPESGGNLYKFADSGIKETLRKLAAFGGVKSRYICKIAGGAQMFRMNGSQGIGNIGERNIRSVKKILREEGIKIRGEDTGSDYARTMLLDIATGEVRIRTSGRREQVL